MKSGKRKKRSSTIGRRTGVDVVADKRIKLLGGLEDFKDYWTSSEGSSISVSSTPEKPIHSSPKISNIQRISSFIKGLPNSAKSDVRKSFTFNAEPNPESFVSSDVSKKKNNSRRNRTVVRTSTPDNSIANDNSPASKKNSKNRKLYAKGRRTGVDMLRNKKIKVDNGVEDFEGYWTETYSEIEAVTHNETRASVLSTPKSKSQLVNENKEKRHSVTFQSPAVSSTITTPLKSRSQEKYNSPIQNTSDELTVVENVSSDNESPISSRTRSPKCKSLVSFRNEPLEEKSSVSLKKGSPKNKSVFSEKESSNGKIPISVNLLPIFNKSVRTPRKAITSDISKSNCKNQIEIINNTSSPVAVDSQQNYSNSDNESVENVNDALNSQTTTQSKSTLSRSKLHKTGFKSNLTFTKSESLLKDSNSVIGSETTNASCIFPDLDNPQAHNILVSKEKLVSPTCNNNTKLTSPVHKDNAKLASPSNEERITNENHNIVPGSDSAPNPYIRLVKLNFDDFSPANIQSEPSCQTENHPDAATVTHNETYVCALISSTSKSKSCLITDNFENETNHNYTVTSPQSPLSASDITALSISRSPVYNSPKQNVKDQLTVAENELPVSLRKRSPKSKSPVSFRKESLKNKSSISLEKESSGDKIPTALKKATVTHNETYACASIPSTPKNKSQLLSENIENQTNPNCNVTSFQSSVSASTMTTPSISKSPVHNSLEQNVRDQLTVEENVSPENESGVSLRKRSLKYKSPDSLKKRTPKNKSSVSLEKSHPNIRDSLKNLSPKDKSLHIFNELVTTQKLQIPRKDTNLSATSASNEENHLNLPQDETVPGETNLSLPQSQNKKEAKANLSKNVAEADIESSNTQSQSHSEIATVAHNETYACVSIPSTPKSKSQLLSENIENQTNPNCNVTSFQSSVSASTMTTPSISKIPVHNSLEQNVRDQLNVEENVSLESESSVSLRKRSPKNKSPVLLEKSHLKVRDSLKNISSKDKSLPIFNEAVTTQNLQIQRKVTNLSATSASNEENHLNLPQDETVPGETNLSLPKSRNRKKTKHTLSKNVAETNIESSNIQSEPTCRRSTRPRVGRLELWRNERRRFNYITGHVLTEEGRENLIGERLNSKLAKKSKNTKSVKFKKKLTDNSVNLNHIQTTINQIAVNNPNTGEDEYVVLCRPWDSLLWSYPQNNNSTNSYQITKCFAAEPISFGYIEINPKQEKEEQYSPIYNITFNIIKGQVLITVNKTKIKLNELDTITIPVDNTYSICNIGNKAALLFFSTFKPPLFDYQVSTS